MPSKGMKKFSKLFSRRLGRSADGSDRLYTRETSPDVHQLTSRRRQGDARTAPRTGINLIVVDDGTPQDEGEGEREGEGGEDGRLKGQRERGNAPCATCRGIDFPKLLDWQPGQPRPWVVLSHTLGDSPCPYCTFFQAMIGARPDETRKFTPYLRIRLAFERLGMGEKHELGRSVLIEVTTKTKSLPWGYIVKAAATNDDDNGSHAGESRNSEANGGSNGAAIRGRVIPRLLDPALPKSWLDFCRANHDERCWKRGPPVKGLRLIDCQAREVVSVDDIRGHVDDSDDTKPLDYLTLSYARGETGPLPEDNDGNGNGNGNDGDRDSDHSSCAPLPDEPPQMVADAMSLTLSLGFRYLWVDRYCMATGPRTTDEAARARELDTLGDILAGSSLALIVAAGSGAPGGSGLGELLLPEGETGMPGISTPREEQLSLRTEAGLLFTTTLLRPDIEIAESDWAASGWTYQEGLLPRRRLVLTASQAYYQCGALHCHETVELPLRLAHDLNGRVFPDHHYHCHGHSHNNSLSNNQKNDDNKHPSSGTAELLKGQINEFMVRNFAHDRDRLDAFRGVLRWHSQQEERPVNHFLGLPLFHQEDFTGPAPPTTTSGGGAPSLPKPSRTDRLAVALSWTLDPLAPSESYMPSASYTSAFPSWTWPAWRVRTGPLSGNHVFRIALAADASPVAPGLRAVPGTGISIGFDDGSVLPWASVKGSDDDGDGNDAAAAAAALAEKSARVSHLRFDKALCFDVRLDKKDGSVSTVEGPLGKANAALARAWFQCVNPNAPDGEHELTAILLSGRNWPAGGAAGAANPSPASGGAATVLLCGKHGSEADAKMMRLGVLAITFEALEMGSGDEATIKLGDADASEKRPVQLRRRQVDIF